MSTESRKPNIDPDGVRVFDKVGRRRSSRLVIGALLVIVLGAIASLLLRRGVDAPDATEVAGSAPLSAQSAARGATSGAPQNARAVQVGPGAQQIPPAKAAAGRETDATANTPTAEEARQQVDSLTRNVIGALRDSGETSGIAAFPPPGTDPIKIGIVVPKDFELPTGYVRHYQITDDGEQLEPILMFSPDYEFQDDNGKPVAVPEDHIVPASMAPPGLPVRMLEPPAGSRAAGADQGSP